jgi:fatty acid-binding protein DegV
VSSALSGTVDLARHRAGSVDIPVEVVDSRMVGGSLGLAVLAAHRVAQAGGSVEEVVAAATRVRDRSESLLVVDTLDYLKRGGRLTGAQALVGNVLRVKPLLHLTEGRVEVRERTRTWSRALDRIVDIVEELADGGPVDVIVAHASPRPRRRAVVVPRAARRAGRTARDADGTDRRAPTSARAPSAWLPSPRPRGAPGGSPHRRIRSRKRGSLRSRRRRGGER